MAGKFRELGSIRDVTLFVYPEAAYGTEYVGDTVLLHTPSRAEVRAGLAKALKDRYNFLVIYSDDEAGYRKIFQTLESEYCLL